MRSIWLGLAAMAGLAGTGQAGSWIHVAVDEGGAKASTVRVNLPLTMVDSLAPLVQDKVGKHAKINMGTHDMSKADLKAIWESVRQAGDAEFVTVEGQGDHVRVAKSGSNIVIKVREQKKTADKASAQDTVTVTIPASVVDALLSSPGDSLNLPAALHELARVGTGHLVTVNDNHDSVRIWIDDKTSSE